MSALSDGWHVLQLHSAEMLVLSGCALLCGGLMLRFVRADGAPEDRVSLAAALWVFPALLLSALALLMARWLGTEVASIWSVLVAALIALALGSRSTRHLRSTPLRNLAGTGILIAFTIVVLLLRLVFVGDLLLPQYFDSATHYGLIRQVQQWVARDAAWQGIGLPAPPYYHRGYHVLMAGLASVTPLELGSLMLISGQLGLALIPLALYAPAHRLSGSGLAALMAVSLAATGWYMPAFAVNWGKYPALFGMLLTIGALTLALMAMESSDEADTRRRLWMLSALMTVAATLVHTRDLVIILMGIAAGLLSFRLWKLPPVGRGLAAAICMLILVALAVLTSIAPALLPVLAPYRGTGLWSTLAALVLAVFGFQHRPRQALAVCVFMALLLTGLMLPFPWNGIGTILDRPFVEMWIFAPLSILGAIGFGGLVPRLSSVGGKVAVVILATAIGAHALAAYDLKASSCCTIVGPDDMAALEWLRNNHKADDLVGIAAEPLQLGTGPRQALQAPVDAGAWVSPLTGIKSLYLAYDLDMGEQATLQDLCQRGVSHVYVGGGGRGFDAASLQKLPAQFAARLRLPEASIFEVVGCEN